MSNLIPRTAWWLLALGIAWQAALGAVDLGGRLWHSRDVGFTQRLGGTTDERLERALGPDFALASALRNVARPNEHVLCRVEFNEAAFAEPDGLVPRLTRLRHALFPTPHVMLGGADPVAMAAGAVPAGQSALVLVLAGETAPTEGDGWRRLHEDPRFQVWRLQR